VQADLLAYHRLLTEQNQELRYASISPLKLCDQHEFLMLRKGKRGRGSRHEQAQRQQMLRRALVKDGASSDAVSWWMKD